MEINDLDDLVRNLNGANYELATLRAENERLRDKLENIVIAYGMGWDMDGVIEAARESLR